jgi:hypothetical protein
MSLPMQGLVDCRSAVGEGSFGCSGAEVFQHESLSPKSVESKTF